MNERHLHDRRLAPDGAPPEEDLEGGGESDGGKDGPTRRASGLYV